MSRPSRAAAAGKTAAATLATDQVREFVFSEADFRSLAQFAYERTGIVLSEAKRNLVYSRLSRRLRVHGLSTFRQYRDLLAADSREVESFVNSISTNHTKFFREAHHFDHFRTHVATEFQRKEGRGVGGRLRVWSAGCSSGEEPYTIAVVLRREIHDLHNHDVRILATDIDTDILTRAASGEFAATAVSEVPRDYQEYFLSAAGSGDRVMVDDDTRSLISFRQLNLLTDWPFSGLFDAIFCRNVMIYFDAPTKTRLVERFTKQIKPGGWLYIGHSESLIGGQPGLQLVGRTTYRRCT